MLSFLNKTLEKRRARKRLGFSPLARAAHNKSVGLRKPQQKMDTQALLKNILEDVKPLFKTQGWTKHRFTFNRKLGDGIVHVIQFELGSHDLSPYETSLTPSYHGLFRINTGVYIPECDPFQESHKKSTYISEISCAFRFGICHILEDVTGDYWIPLDAPTAEIQDEISTLLTRYIFPTLERFSNRRQIYEQWLANPNFVHMDVVTDFSLAKIFETIGYHDDANSIFRKKFKQYYGTIPTDQELIQWKLEDCPTFGFKQK